MTLPASQTGSLGTTMMMEAKDTWLGLAPNWVALSSHRQPLPCASSAAHLMLGIVGCLCAGMDGVSAWRLC